jgi:hypothetical protein
MKYDSVQKEFIRVKFANDAAKTTGQILILDASNNNTARELILHGIDPTRIDIIERDPVVHAHHVTNALGCNLYLGDVYEVLKSRDVTPLYTAVWLDFVTSYLYNVRQDLFETALRISPTAHVYVTRASRSVIRETVATAFKKLRRSFRRIHPTALRQILRYKATSNMSTAIYRFGDVGAVENILIRAGNEPGEIRFC